jgi:hypothetical protein
LITGRQGSRLPVRAIVGTDRDETSRNVYD